MVRWAGASVGARKGAPGWLSGDRVGKWWSVSSRVSGA